MSRVLAATDLAVLLKKRNKKKESERCFRRAMLGRDLQLGGNHPDTLESMSNLALFLSEQKNRLGEAESLHRRVCARWSKSRGPEHPGTLSAVTQLAQFLDVKRSRSSLECAEEATKLYERAYLSRKAKLGPDHPSTHFSLFLLNRFKQKRAKREGGSNNNQNNAAIPQITSMAPTGMSIPTLSCF